MNTVKAISEFRTDTFVDESQLPDPEALVFLNRARRKMINRIRIINEDYYYDEWKRDSVATQREYPLIERSDTEAGIVKIKGVSVKYTNNNGDEYRKLTPTTIANLPRDPQWYITNQPASDPFYIVSDNSTFVYPAPLEIVSDGIILYGIGDPSDVTLTSTEAEMKIPLEYHDLLPLGMAAYRFKAENMTNEKNDALNEFNGELARMESELSDRIVVPIESEMPCTSHLQ